MHLWVAACAVASPSGWLLLLPVQLPSSRPVRASVISFLFMMLWSVMCCRVFAILEMCHVPAGSLLAALRLPMA